MLDMLVPVPPPEQPAVEIRPHKPYPRELNIIRPDPIDPALVVRYEEGEGELLVRWSGHAQSSIVAAQVFPSVHEAEIQAIMGGSSRLARMQSPSGLAS